MLWTLSPSHTGLTRHVPYQKGWPSTNNFVFLLARLLIDPFNATDEGDFQMYSQKENNESPGAAVLTP